MSLHPAAETAVAPSRPCEPPRCCERCGKALETRKARQRFCSRTCARLFQHQSVKERVCEACKRPFIAKKYGRSGGQRFCSILCCKRAWYAANRERARRSL